MDRQNIFISYSWDSEEHQEWVKNFTNKLRSEGGVEATIDILETQQGTTHLPRMMVENIRDSDFTIIVLTTNYKEKAEAFSGGVGFENENLLSLLQQDKDRLVFIKRDQANFEDVVPSHFQGYYIIDFSRDAFFDQKFQELLHRLYNAEYHKKAPLGDIPEFSSHSSNYNPVSNIENLDRNDEFDSSLTSFANPITDIDKNRFLYESYDELHRLLILLLNQVQEKSTYIEYEYWDITRHKSFFTTYKNGEEKLNLKVWIGSLMGPKHINFHIGKLIDPNTDNAMSESISTNIVDGKLQLKNVMDMRGSEASTAKEIIQDIWMYKIKPFLE